MLADAHVDTDVILPEFPVPPEDINTTTQILDLIRFVKEYNLQKVSPKYRRLVESEDIIREFDHMIGLQSPKSIMATQILSLCNKMDSNKEILLNTVIYGPPGCGKTTMAHFLSKLYLKFGILEDGKIIKGDRANMIGEYVGDTAIKTKKRLKEALGGVLFIDEAYQLGHAADGNRCPFAYECINTITQFITEHKGKIVVIMAGYKDDIQKNVFAQNEGLARRFPWEYTLDKYSSDELLDIFKNQTALADYTLADGVLTSSFFEENKDMFTNSGGDTETLFAKCKMVHDKRMFSLLKPDSILSKTDIDKGYAIFKKCKEEAGEDEIPGYMYS